VAEAGTRAERRCYDWFNQTLEPTATARLARARLGFKLASSVFGLALPVAVAQPFRSAKMFNAPVPFRFLTAFVLLLGMASSGCGKQQTQKPMSAKVVAEQQITVGQKSVVEAASPDSKHVVVSEDDGDTGYFYALDFARADNPIVDALHIYNAASVTDRHVPSAVQILWSADNLKAMLLINRYPHAVFDFAAKRGYCRTAFPPPDKKWTAFGHEWDDKVTEMFR
jgi:hypothetical protein